MESRTLLTSLDLDRYAEGLAVEYRGYLIGLTGTLAGILDRPSPKTSRARSDLDRNIAEQLSSRYSYLSNYVHGAVIAAINAAFDHRSNINGLTEDEADELYSIVGETASALIDELLAMMTRDAGAIKRAWAQFAMDANLRVNQRRGSALATLQARQGKIAGLRFRQPDAIGRGIESALFARNSFRLLLVRTQVEVQLYLMKKAGIDTATATWSDGRQEVTFSISDEYMELRDGLFHPNSTAMLK